MSEETQDLLRTHLRSVESAAVPSNAVVGEGIARFERRVERRRRVLASTSAIATVALVVGVVWNTSASPQQITGADGVPSTTASFSTEVPPTTLAGTGPWSAIPIGQFKPITGATVVWTGTEAMMIGGTFADGTWAGIHAYNPTTSTWRVVEASFIGDKPIVGDNPLVFWSGTLTFLIGASESTGESMVVGYDSNDGLSFRQQTGNADFVDATVPWAWTGTELLVWPTAGDELPARRPRAFDPLTGQWRVVAEPPIEARTDAASIWTGTEWIVWGGTGSSTFADGAAYNPTTDTWRLLAPSPLSPRTGPGVWTGSEMIVRSASPDGAAYDPLTDTWRKIASGVAHPGFMPVWTGDLLILFAKGGAVWYNPATDQWASGDFAWGDVAHLDQSPVWTGEVVLLLGSYDGSTGGAAFTPPQQ